MPIEYVNSAQVADMTAGFAGPSVVTPGQSHTSGNLLVVAVRYYNESGQTVNSITDTAGNTYTAISEYTNPSNDYLGLFYAKNIGGNASNAVSVNFSDTVRFVSVQVLQYSGCHASSPFDTTARSNGFISAATVTSAAFTTSQANEVLVAAAQIGSTSGSWTADTGYTKRVDSTSNVVMMQDKIVSSIQTSVTVSATNTNDVNTKTIIVATFKEAPEVPLLPRRSPYPQLLPH